MDPKSGESGLTVTESAWRRQVTAYVVYFRVLGRQALGDMWHRAPLRWWVGALVWGVASYAILVNHLEISGVARLNETWLICSLMWAQFGLAAVFAALTKRQMEVAANRLFITLVPPLLLHLIIFSIVL